MTYCCWCCNLYVLFILYQFNATIYACVCVCGCLD